MEARLGPLTSLRAQLRSSGGTLTSSSIGIGSSHLRTAMPAARSAVAPPRCASASAIPSGRRNERRVSSNILAERATGCERTVNLARALLASAESCERRRPLHNAAAFTPDTALAAADPGGACARAGAATRALVLPARAHASERLHDFHAGRLVQLLKARLRRVHSQSERRKCHVVESVAG